LIVSDILHPMIRQQKIAPEIPIKRVSYSSEKPVIPSRTIDDFYVVSFDNQETPNRIFIKITNQEKEKEKDYNLMWKNSEYKLLLSMKPNNIGLIGEKFIEHVCKVNKIDVQITGSTVKNAEIGDLIKTKTIEIKTALQGSTSPSFQHELGETPWLAEYILFIDISPDSIYLTIFKNFEKDHYMNKKRCDPFFPSKTVTRRKNVGAFKLDTTLKINQSNILNGHTMKFTDNTSFEEIGKFINDSIKN